METNGEDKKIEIPENSGENQEIRNNKGQFIKGVSGNPAGKPTGLKNFETDFLEAVGKIAEANNLTRAEAMEVLLRKAYSEAKNGQFNFYQDIMNRLYGKVVERTDLTSKGEKIVIMPAELINKNDTSSLTEHNSEGQA